jgi:hypothetical protein
MDDAERDQVRRALELEDGAAMAAALDRFGGAEQLHQFLANYNVNDGLLPCLAIARHPRCDRGTATWLYFQFSDLLFHPEARADEGKKAPEWNADAVLSALESRFATSDFASEEFEFDPVKWLSLNALQLRRLVDAGVPEKLLRLLGSRRIEPEWLR